ncbi:uncharacterized protein PHALS_13200 [Plasmopara halstedii]|uniref:Uncharacterized protein n=1 Tax=Plasmopara halstedii TaxID=4781 RepID=A0A0P1AQ22_PLAHL|nr:uncharacterized protein PHALS_13200 [Plasmopara halstedii]CEG42968.1 hypothetical protein PHALS_13200 [Plasmopara halstedii]|eukprot:XP_024579337.1 hypothetical protein PHALS_13200 [Plasmopara halstedii]
MRSVARPLARRKPVLMKANGSDDDESVEDSEGPLTPKRAKIDDDEQIAEAVLGYAVSIDAYGPTNYVCSINGKRRCDDAMDAELPSHEENRMWTLKPRGKSKRINDYDGNLPRSVIKMAMSCDTRHDWSRKDSSKSKASTFSRLITRSPT